MATSPSFLSSTASSTSGWLFKSAKPAGSTRSSIPPCMLSSLRTKTQSSSTAYREDIRILSK
ncbi:unnamed protein product [Rhodiola kirilowii]